jgi:uncharacterized protein
MPLRGVFIGRNIVNNHHMSSASLLVQKLGLVRHPEGGHFRETYRSNAVVRADIEQHGFDGQRNLCTSIYFLLSSGERSLLHKIKSDEIWNFHMGSSLSIFVFNGDDMTVLKLGDNPDAGESFQHVVPAGAWFGAIVNRAQSFTLAGCTVAPGFDFKDFQLAKRADLLQEYPLYKKEIELLTNPE